jgi:uncharacterized protein (DUF1501 family)
VASRHVSPTRRSILQLSWRSLAAVGVASSLPESFASSGRNRTLVCIYLFGGNDANSMLVPLNDAQYAAYAQVRGELALRADRLLPIRALQSQAPYGFHPAMGELQQLYSQGVLGIMANVGSLTHPNSHTYESLSFFKGGSAIPKWAGGAEAPADATLGFDNGVALLPIDAAGARRDHQLHQSMARSASRLFRTPFPDTGIGQSLRHIAGMIELGGTMGLGRQVFLASFGGFDTHWSQAERHAGLLRDLSAAMQAFYGATLELGLANQVTTITDSEFGRSLFPNHAHGTENGWGSHQLVMGGAVVGGDIYGRFPDLSSNAEFDASGALIPTTSNDRFHGTLKGWLNSTSSVDTMGFLA